jgi:hypothetical protein
MTSEHTAPGDDAARPSRETPRGGPGGRAAFRLAAAAVVILGMGLRFWALDFGLPNPRTRPDEEVLLRQTRHPAEGNFDLKFLVYPHAYVYLTWAWGAAGLELGQALGLVPEGDYVSLLRSRFPTVILVSRVLSAAAGTAATAAVIAVTRAALGPGAALAAGVLVATSFLHVRDSHAVKPDVLLSLATLLAVAAMVPLARRATVGRGIAAGCVVGLAMGIKYPALLLLGSAYVAACLGAGHRRWRRLVSGPGLAACLAAGVAFVATSPHLLFDPQAQERFLGFFSILFPRAGPVASDAVSLSTAGYPDPMGRPWWEGFVTHATFSLRYGIGLLPTLLAAPAVAWGLGRRPGARGWPLTPLCAVTVLVHYAVFGASPAVQTRYMTPIIPLLAILEGGLLAWLAGRIGQNRGGRVLVVLTAIVVAEPLASTVAHNRIIDRTDTRVLATRWMEAHVPAGSAVLGLGTQFWVWGMPDVPPGVRLVAVAPDPRALGAAGVRYVLTHEHELFSSRVNPEAMEALAPYLTELVVFDPFTPGRDAAVFEARDAYYVPYHNFGAVRRPGPLVRIYAFEID